MFRWPWAKEERADEAETALLRALLPKDSITRETALCIPSVAECVDVISNTVAMLPVKLYRDAQGKAEEITDDPRVFLLNDEPGGLMDSFQMKKAWVTDYLLDGRGYLYIERDRNLATGLRYVAASDVSAVVSPGPIYKTADLLVGGQTYRDFEFLKITRRSRDGVRGFGVIQENATALAVAYNSLLFENALVKAGGRKRGFLKATERVGKDALITLQEAFKRTYQSDDEMVFALNKGVDFQEASNTSAEMQLNENKKTNAAEMCKLFNTPPPIIDGTAKDEEVALWAKICIAPILTAIESALNKDLLLYTEKRRQGNGALYFSMDTTELLKGDMQKRFAAYQIAAQNNIMQIDEIRYKENLPPLGVNFIKLGLQDVLYDPATGELFTPNTGKKTRMDEAGEQPEDRPEPAVPEITENVEPAQSMDPEPEKIAQVSLNGAQIASILQVIGSVGRGEIERESALKLLTSAFPFSNETAKEILGNPKPVLGGGEAE